MDTDPTLTLTTSANGTASATGVIPGGFYFYPEGVLAFAGAPFDSVLLSSAALTFTIDNITVDTVPAPAGSALFAAALVGFAITRRRQAFRNS